MINASSIDHSGMNKNLRKPYHCTIKWKSIFYSYPVDTVYFFLKQTVLGMVSFSIWKIILKMVYTTYINMCINYRLFLNNYSQSNIDFSCYNFENCLPPQFVSQSFLGPLDWLKGVMCKIQTKDIILTFYVVFGIFLFVIIWAKDLLLFLLVILRWTSFWWSAKKNGK